MAPVLMCGVEDVLFSGSRLLWTVTVAALRRCYSARLRACRQALRAWCGLRDVYQVKNIDPAQRPGFSLQQRPGFSLRQHPGTCPRACSLSEVAAMLRSTEAALGGCSEGPELALSWSRCCFPSAGAVPAFRGWGGNVFCAKCVLSVNPQVFWPAAPHITPPGSPSCCCHHRCPRDFGAELREPLSACALGARWARLCLCPLPWESLAVAFSAVFVSLNSGSL